MFGIGIEFAGFKPRYVPRLEESINIYIESPFSCLLFQWRNYIEIYQYKAKCKGKVENLKYISNNSSQLGPGMGRKFLCSHRWNWIIQRNDEWMDGRWWLGDGALQWRTFRRKLPSYGLPFIHIDYQSVALHCTFIMHKTFRYLVL